MAKKGDGKTIADELTAKELKALEALLVEPSIKDAAKSAGVSYTQLRRWLERPDFAEAYRRARTITFETVLASLQTITGEAVETLRELMRDGEVAASVRANCAGKLLDAGVRSRELFDNEARLAELEARFNAMSNQSKS